MHLFSMTKPRNQRRDRDKIEIEYEKECDECTFQPDITIVKAKTGWETKKGFEKSINRMKQGRLIKKLKENI